MKLEALLLPMILWALVPTSCAVVQDRKVANIFYENDRKYEERTALPHLGSVHTVASLKSIVGTAFLIDSCYIATSYHLIRSTDEKMQAGDHIFYLPGHALDLADEKSYVKAEVVAWGKPYLGHRRDRAREDWAILKLETCSDAAPFTLKEAQGSSLVPRTAKFKVKASLYGFPVDRDINLVSYDPACTAYLSHMGPFVHHDCAVRTGNSGGPLVASEGHVMAIQSEARGHVDGVFSSYDEFWANIACPIGPVIEALKSLKSNH